MEFILKSIKFPNYRSFTGSAKNFYRDKVAPDVIDHPIKSRMKSDKAPLGSPPKVPEILSNNKINNFRKDEVITINSPFNLSTVRKSQPSPSIMIERITLNQK